MSEDRRNEPVQPNQPTEPESPHAGMQLSDSGADPTDGYEPVPLWLITIFGALLAWGGWYVGTYNGGWRWYELDEYSGMGTAPVAHAEEDPIALGKRIFAGNCVSCHQASGEGLPGQYPTLHASEWVLGNPAWMKRIVLQGLEGPIEVAGARYNNVMPGLGVKLTDKQVAAVINYVRTNAAWGNNAEAITPEDVAATRAATRDRTVPWTASELQAIQQDERGEQAAGSAGTSATAPATNAAPQ